MLYEPDAKGMLEARKALAKHVTAKGIQVSEQQLILTSSTSEAYSYLFKLLGNPSDKALIPSPGYPLLELLARLDSIQPIPYPFKTQPGWPLDRPQFINLLKENPKFVLSVNPQNPTGVPLSDDDLVFVLEQCALRSMAFISDEVFWDFLMPTRPIRLFPNPNVLTFRLGGISKSLGLPQLKLAWIIVEGPALLVSESIERLDFISDTYLSLQSPVQNSLSKLLSTSEHFQNQVMVRISQNRRFLEAKFAVFNNRVKLWPMEGGWYNLIEIVNSPFNDEAWVIALMNEEKVIIQPGCFYDIEEGCFGVISLITKREIFELGVDKLIQFLRKKLRV